MLAPDRASSPFSPSEAIDQAASTLYGQEVSHWGGANRWRLRARLLGGGADGRSVELDSLMDAIAVYFVEDQMIACDRALPHGGEGRFIGVYQLATGTGPELPVYVAGI